MSEEEYPYEGEEVMTRVEFLHAIRSGCYNEHDGDAYAWRDGKKAELLDWSSIESWGDFTHVLWVSK